MKVRSEACATIVWWVLLIFQCCVNVSELPFGYLLGVSTIYKSTPDLFLMFAVFVVYCQCKKGAFQRLCIIFRKGKRWETPTKTRGLMQPPLPGAEENFICTWDTSNRLSITNVQPFIRAHPVTWVWSLFPTFFPSFFHFFGGAIDFMIYRWTSANTEKRFFKNPWSRVTWINKRQVTKKKIWYNHINVLHGQMMPNDYTRTASLWSGIAKLWPMALSYYYRVLFGAWANKLSFLPYVFFCSLFVEKANPFLAFSWGA